MILQVSLAAVPDSDRFLMLGDFNTRVGYCRSDDHVWSVVLDHHRLDVRNQAGEDFLNFVKSISYRL